jgi:AcrR family transcriptional regulator
MVILTGSRDPELFERVVAAARRCFARFGVDRTTMQDIAREAGIGRTGVYRMGVNRPELTEAAIVSRLRELGEGIRPMALRPAPFAQLLVETSIATIEAARGDPELRHLLDTTETVALHRLLTGPDAVMHQVVLDLLAPMFARARAAGEMRADINDDRAVQWLRGVYLMLILREDLDEEGERMMVRDFVLPSLLAR